MASQLVNVLKRSRSEFGLFYSQPNSTKNQTSLSLRILSRLLQRIKKLEINPNVIFVSLLVMFASNSIASSIEPRIYNGESTRTQDWPFMVSLVIKNTTSKFCGGSLIAKSWVLTAGHCVQKITEGDFKILVNASAAYSNDQELIAVERIYRHNQYDQPTRFNNDIALIKLATPSKFQPVEVLAEHSDQDDPGRKTVALGWGVTDYLTALFGITSLDLQQISLPIAENSTCQNYYSNSITNNMLCAGFANGSLGDTCAGDSGGPLLVFDPVSGSWKQAGLTSFGRKYCGLGTYGVYTRVKNYARYISDAICLTEETPATPDLQVNVEGSLVRLSWPEGDNETTYSLLYKTPEEIVFHTLELNHETSFSVNLPRGSNYEVKIEARKGNCFSKTDSNTERVEVNGN